MKRQHRTTCLCEVRLDLKRFVARVNCLFLWYVQFHSTVINTYKTVNLAWQCNFEILVALLHEKSNLHKLSNKHKIWYLKNTT